MTDEVKAARVAQEEAEVALRVAEAVQQCTQQRCATECARVAQAYGAVRRAVCVAYAERSGLLRHRVLAARSPVADGTAAALADAAAVLAGARSRARHIALARSAATFAALVAVQLRELTRVRDALDRVRHAALTCRGGCRCAHPGALVCDDARSLTVLHRTRRLIRDMPHRWRREAFRSSASSTAAVSAVVAPVRRRAGSHGSHSSHSSHSRSGSSHGRSSHSKQRSVARVVVQKPSMNVERVAAAAAAAASAVASAAAAVAKSGGGGGGSGGGGGKNTGTSPETAVLIL